jgi:hypothetical protein
VNNGRQTIIHRPLSKRYSNVNSRN